MERKFVPKLNQLKPAAIAREHANSTVRETIKSVLNFIISISIN
jgi:hypothetical protein